MRVMKVKVLDVDLKDALWLRGPHEKKLWDILQFVKENQPVRAKELEVRYGADVIYNILQKLVNSGMLDKTEDGYVLSTRFSQLLRKFADEWEDFVR